MTLPKISLQLYTLREQIASDFRGTLHPVAEIGFPCAESAGLHHCGAENAAKVIDELGPMTAPSGHCKLPIGEHKNEAIDEALMLRHEYMNTGVFPQIQKDYDSAKNSRWKSIANHTSKKQYG